MSERTPVWALGAMSGTSLDGVDAAMVLTDGVRVLDFGRTGYRDYTDAEREVLRAALGKASGPEVAAAAEVVELDRPLPPDSGTGLVCPHCQFAQVGKSAFFCPKCGMRLLRG